MENASRALLIAGGVLLAMLILGIGVYLFINSRTVGDSYQQRVEINEIQKVNSNFTVFLERSDITAQEIVTAINYSKKYKEENGIDIDITLTGSGLSSWTTNKISESEEASIGFIKYCNGENSDGKQITFKCNYITYYNEGIDAGIVKTVTFVKN